MADGASAARLESLDGIPEFLHAQFVPVQDGEKTLYEHKPPVSKTAADVERSQNALRKERERATQLAKQLDEAQRGKSKIIVGEDELDEDQIAALWLEKKKQAGQQTLTREEADRLADDRANKKLKAKEDSHRQELETERTSRIAAEADRDSVLIDDRLRAAATDATLPFRMRPEAIDDLVAFVHDKKLARVEGRRLIALDGAGDLLGSASNDSEAAAELIQYIITTYKKPHWLFDSQGTGAPPNANSGNGHARFGQKKRSEMTPAEKGEYIEKYGGRERKISSQPAYLELPMK